MKFNESEQYTTVDEFVSSLHTDLSSSTVNEVTDNKIPSAAPAIAIVGAGPRGASLVERLGAYLREPAFAGRAVVLHIIDDAQVGSGRIWNTEQTRTLCMNTLAGAVTLFTEPGSTVGAPVLEGPTMFEWIQALRGEEIPAAKAALVERYPAHVPDEFKAEMDATVPESNPSRALYGEYIAWVFEVALGELPETATVECHAARAVRLTESDGVDVIELSDGTRIEAATTVMASGWTTPALNAEERALAAAEIEWVAPANPVEQDLSAVPAGEDVLVRGLGMGFFDVMARLTIDRGGRFIEDESARAGLRYIASGREPRLIVSSGRGYPYLPKSEYHSLPPRANLERLAATIEASRVEPRTNSLNFGRVLWPALVRDAFAEYYRTLAEVRPEALTVPLAEILATIDEDLPVDQFDATITPAALETKLGRATFEPFVLTDWFYPLAGTEGMTCEELTAHIATGMERDIAEAVAARRSPLKAGLWAISAGRKPSSIAGSNGRFCWESRSGSFNQFMALGQMVGSGPPLFRTRELLALVDAGLVTFLGARPALTLADGEATLTAGTKAASASVLIDAWMHSPDVRHRADPLTLSLGERVRPFVDDGQETGSPETTHERRTVHADGTVDERLHVVGIPTYAQWPDTTISPMPGTDPLMLQETDRAAADLLALI